MPGYVPSLRVDKRASETSSFQLHEESHPAGPPQFHPLAAGGIISSHKDTEVFRGTPGVNPLNHIAIGCLIFPDLTLLGSPAYAPPLGRTRIYSPWPFRVFETISISPPHVEDEMAFRRSSALPFSEMRNFVFPAVEALGAEPRMGTLVKLVESLEFGGDRNFIGQGEILGAASASSKNHSPASSRNIF